MFLNTQNDSSNYYSEVYSKCVPSVVRCSAIDLRGFIQSLSLSADICTE